MCIKYWGINTKYSLKQRIFFFCKRLWNPLLAENIIYRNIVYNILSHNKYKYIVVRHIETAIITGLIREGELILDVDDLPEEVLKSRMKTRSNKNYLRAYLRNLYYIWMIWRMKICTTNFLNKIKHSYFPNKGQCLYKNSSYLPNIPYPLEKLNDCSWNKKENIVLFVGLFTHLPNLFGIDHFIDKIWPGIIKKNPSAILYLAGGGLPQKFIEKWSKISNVKVCGYVENLVSLYECSKVVIAPIYEGGGTNIKVLEAINMKSPCVISNFAYRGFEEYFKDGEHLFIANTDEIFIEKVCLLLQSQEWCDRLVFNSFAAVQRNFSLNVFRKYLLDGLLN